MYFLIIDCLIKQPECYSYIQNFSSVHDTQFNSSVFIVDVGRCLNFFIIRSIGGLERTGVNNWKMNRNEESPLCFCIVILS